MSEQNVVNELSEISSQRGRKLRVLLLAHSTTRTGSPLVALSLFENLHDEIDLFTISLDHDELVECFEQLGPFQSLFNEHKTNKIARLLPRGGVVRFNAKMAQWRMRRWGEPDLIYVNSMLGLYVARYLKLGNAPALLHIHELDEGLTLYPPQKPELFYEWPQRYIAVSQAVREALENVGIAADKIEVIHEWIEQSSDSQKPLRERNAPWVIGASGHVSWRKGLDLWLLMAAELVRILGRERVRFVWVGLDESLQANQARLKARKMGLSDVMEWVSVTSNPQAHFARFDVFAMTSWEDPCPLVVLENMLLQTPVACFAPGGGAQEEVGDTGIVVDGFHPYEMAKQIADLLQDEPRRKSLGEKARHRVLEHFTSDVQVPRIRRILYKIAPNKTGN